MHQLVRRYLEEYLQNASDPRIPGEFRQHLRSCAGCAEEVRQFESHAVLLRSLRRQEYLAPPAEFYARVATRIEEQRAASVWSAFLEPVFGRRLVFACLTLVLLLGAYIVSTEPQVTLSPGSPEVVMAVEPHPFEVTGSDPRQDREKVLITLATYQE